jgi:DNA polymerase-3 subunit gamma/tau
MVAHDARTITLLDAAPEHQKLMGEQSARFTPQWLYRAMDICSRAELDYRAVSDKQFLVELTLIKLCQLCQADSPSPNISGNGEGQLLKIFTAAPTPTRTPAPAADAAPTPAPAAPVSMPAAPATVDVSTPQHHAPTAKPTAARTAHRNTIGPRVSINASTQAHTEASQDSSATSAADAAHTEKRNTPYTAEALDAVWQTYIARHPEAKLLIHTMQHCRPVATATQHLFRVTVESTPQLETMTVSLPDILKYVRAQLANDNISIEFYVNQGKGSMETWSEREIYAYMLEKHPCVRRLANTLRLKLD